MPSSLGDAPQCTFPRDSARYVDKVIRDSERRMVPGPGAYETQYLERLETLAISARLEQEQEQEEEEGEFHENGGYDTNDEGKGEGGFNRGAHAHDEHGGEQGRGERSRAPIDVASEGGRTPAARPASGSRRRGPGTPRSARASPRASPRTPRTPRAPRTPVSARRMGASGAGGGASVGAMDRYQQALWAQEEAEYWKFGPEPLRPTSPTPRFGRSTRAQAGRLYAGGPLNKPVSVSPGPAKYQLKGGSSSQSSRSPQHSFGGKGIARNMATHEEGSKQGPASAVASSSFGRQTNSRSPTSAASEQSKAPRGQGEKLYTGKAMEGLVSDTPGPQYDSVSAMGDQVRFV